MRLHTVYTCCLCVAQTNLISIPFRYASLTCPLCEDAVAERDEALSEIRSQLNTDDVSFLNRVEEFEHLLMIGMECKLLSMELNYLAHTTGKPWREQG